MKTKGKRIPSGNNLVIVGGKRYVKVVQAARRLGVSRATMYRQLLKLRAAGIEIIRTSSRITLINESDLERYLVMSHFSHEGEARGMDALRRAQRVRALIRERHSLFPEGSAAEAVRRVREPFGA